MAICLNSLAEAGVANPMRGPYAHTVTFLFYTTENPKNTVLQILPGPKNTVLQFYQAPENTRIKNPMYEQSHMIKHPMY